MTVSSGRAPPGQNSQSNKEEEEKKNLLVRTGEGKSDSDAHKNGETTGV